MINQFIWDISRGILIGVGISVGIIVGCQIVGKLFELLGMGIENILKRFKPFR